MSGSSPADTGAPVAVTARAALAELTTALGDADEARWVLATASGVSPARLGTLGSDPVPPGALAAARHMAMRRAAGEPLQYVLGTWAFRTLEVTVDPRVLVPRPETEQVTQLALDALCGLDHRRGRPLVAVDLGTGSGVIALSLLAEGPSSLEVWATDRSPAALDVTRENLARLEARRPQVTARLHLAEGSWFGALPEPLAGHVDLVVSNPPYVSAAEWAALDPVVRDHEPTDALVPGPSGREALEHLVDEAPAWLAGGGVLVLELAPHQAGHIAGVARRRGYAEVSVLPDLAGRDRAVVASLLPGGC